LQLGLEEKGHPILVALVRHETAPSLRTRFIIPTTGSQSASLIEVNMHRPDKRLTNSKAVGGTQPNGFAFVPHTCRFLGWQSFGLPNRAVNNMLLEFTFVLSFCSAG
jgi:hypothetical protein